MPSFGLLRRRMSTDELEDGEIDDDEDDQLWEQLEEAETTTNNSPASTSTSILNKSLNNLSTSIISSSSKNHDRFVGGFWAKLKSTTSIQSQNTGQEYLLPMNGQLANPSTNRSKMPIDNFVPLEENSQLAEQRRDGDEEELLELQLRLEALQSTMKRGHSIKPPTINDRSSRHRKSSSSRSKTSHSSYSRHHRRESSSNRSGNYRYSDHKDYRRSKKDPLLKTPARLPLIPKRPLVIQVPNPNPNLEQLQWQRERILNMPDPKEQFQAFISMVSMPKLETSPRESLAAKFVKPRYSVDNLETTNMDISSDCEDEHSSMTASITSVSTKSGFWSRPSPSLNKSYGEHSVSTEHILRELDNGMPSLPVLPPPPLMVVAQPATPEIIITTTNEENKLKPLEVITIEDEEDNNEEEMEALRELALKSMMKKAQKNFVSPVTKLIEEENPILEENHESASNLEINKSIEISDNEDTEFVITLDQELLKSYRQRNTTDESIEAPPSNKKRKMSTSSTNSKRRFELPQKEKSVENEAGKEKSVLEINTKTSTFTKLINNNDSPVSSNSAASPSNTYFMDNRAQRNGRMAMNNKLQQVVKVVHKQVLIPLESDSSDEETSTVTNLVNDQNGNRVTSGTSTSSMARILLNDFLKNTVNGGSGRSSPMAHSPKQQSSPSSNVTKTTNLSLINQLEERLRMCVEDLTKHQSYLNEDKKRLRTLESIVSRQKSDLRISEMRVQKLKQELRMSESQSASYRVTMAKFNGEIEKVQSRLDKNYDLQRLYLKQWKEIEELVTKHKIDIMPKIPDAVDLQPLDDPKKGVNAQKLLPISRRRSSKNNKIAGKKKKVVTKKPMDVEGQKTTAQSDTSQMEAKDIYSNPLRWFKSYRLSTSYRNMDQYPHHSLTFANKLDPFVPLCPYALSGQCLDPDCIWQHEKDFRFNEIEMIADLLSYRPDVVAAGADEKTVLVFAKELYDSLQLKLPLNEILLYCLSQLKMHVQDKDGSRLGIELEPRRWIIRQQSNRYNLESMAIREMQMNIEKDRELEMVNSRYFCKSNNSEDMECSSSAVEKKVDDGGNQVGTKEGE